MNGARSAGTGTMARAAAEYKSGDYESAIATLAAVTVDEQNYIDLAYLIGLCYARLNRFDEALLYLEQVVTQGESDARTTQCRLALAYLYSATGRARLAEYELAKLIEASGETPQLCSAMGHSSWKQGRLDDGLRWYARAMELAPDSPSALNGYGYLLACAEKDLTLALTCCRKALNEDPGNPAYADSLGWAYFKLGRLEEAETYLRSAARTLVDNEEARAHIEEYEKAVRSR